MDINVIARFIALGVVLINSILTMFNINPIPFSQEEAYSIVSIVLTCAVTIYAAWKNNSVTKEAKMADKVMVALKNGEYTLESLQEALEVLKTIK
jgi:SPP1 family holin